jgi:hypothetical protein
MRTTITIEDDVLDRARGLAAKLHTPFRHVINEALRVGLNAAEAPTEQQAYRTTPRKMGVKPGRNLDRIQELLSQIEGEDRR